MTSFAGMGCRATSFVAPIFDATRLLSAIVCERRLAAIIAGAPAGEIAGNVAIGKIVTMKIVAI